MLLSDSECCLGQCWDTGTIGLSLEMWPLRFYTDDKASTNFKQLPSELPWIAFVLCLLQYQHDQKTFAKFCQKHNQKNAFTILVPLGWLIPVVAVIRCVQDGNNIGINYPELPQGNCNQKENDLSSNFLSRALGSLQVTAAVTGIYCSAAECHH